MRIQSTNMQRDVLNMNMERQVQETEFLIGKLLSNNLINLRIYDRMKALLEKYGKDLSRIEEVEPEPSLGNGGLGRLAACYLDSIATLGLAGEGIGLNYHYGIFKQVLEDHLQKEEKDPWIEPDSWETQSDVSFDVYFGDRKVTTLRRGERGRGSCAGGHHL